MVKSILPQAFVSFIDKSIYLHTLGLSLPPGYPRPSISFVPILVSSYIINPNCILLTRVVPTH